MATKTLDPRVLDLLREAMTGPVVAPRDRGYDEARTIFNAMIDKRPAVIAQCMDEVDVATALTFAREQELEVAVRGGGHSVAGSGLTDGGLVIDLRRMNKVVVNHEEQYVVVGGGATMSHLDRATEQYGLATTGGRVSTTGVGGFTLGGGTGWFDRKLGLACDRLLWVDVVRADASRLRASGTENPELFWALHGGGGNFGVATRMAFRLDQLPVVTAALLLWPPDEGPRVLRRYRDVIEGAPDDVGGGFLYLTGPPEEFVPPELVDRLACAVLVAFAGEEEQARPHLAPLLDLAPVGRMVAEMPYGDFQCMLDDPPGFRNYWSAEHLADLPDNAVDVFCGRAGDMVVPSPSQHVLFPLGGVAGREGREWPIAWRSAPWVVHPFGLWDDPGDDERAKAWTRDVREDMRPWATGAVYLNFTGTDEGEARVRAAFGEPNYRRLAAVKTQHDPANVFHVNHNIKPTPTIPSPR